MFNVTPDVLDKVVNCTPESPWDNSLKLFYDKDVSVYYAPFDHVNLNAKVAICGITPGKTQASESLSVAQKYMNAGASITDVLEQSKQAASFKGFRKPLAAMMDAIGLQDKLALGSCDALFDTAKHMVHYTSALRYPVVTAKGENYNGNPRITKHPQLIGMVEAYLAKEVEMLGVDCLWIPLGQSATEALEHLVKIGKLRSEQLLSGLPHPSGANAERVAYFLGNKSRENLSIKVNPVKLDENKSKLISKIKSIRI